MSEWMRFLLSLTLAGSLVTAVSAAAVRLCRSWAPKRFLYCLWLPALACFLLPLGAVRAELPRPETGVWVQWTVEPGEGNPVLPPEEPAFVPAPKRQIAWRELSAALWAAGAAGALGWKLVSCCNFRRRVLGGARPAEAWEQALLERLLRGRRGPRLLRAADQTGPLLMGMGRGVLLLPGRSFSPEMLEDVLEHELCHWRRRDLAGKRLAALCTCLHWFNPVCWWLARQLARDCELACDEAVTARRDEGMRLRYGRTLVLTAAGGGPDGWELTTPMCDQKQRLKERLEAIMTKKRYGKRTIAALCAAALAVLLSTAVLGASVEAPEPVPQAAPAEQSEPRPEGNSVPAEAPREADAQPGEGLRLPVEQEILVVSQLFGKRVHPLTGRTASHEGVDIAAGQGADVLASGGGTVTASAFEAAYGNYVVIDHGAGVSTLYAHLESRAAAEGDSVSQGQVIGQVGSTGMATGAHLHFEVRQDDSPMDPLTAMGLERVLLRAEGKDAELRLTEGIEG